MPLTLTAYETADFRQKNSMERDSEKSPNLWVLHKKDHFYVVFKFLLPCIMLLLISNWPQSKSTLILFCLCRNAFISTVRRLALLRDPNVAQIVAACTQDEPLCVLSEFSDYGDLCHFLKSHQPHNLSHYSNTNDLNTSLSSGSSGTSSGLK